MAHLQNGLLLATVSVMPDQLDDALHKEIVSLCERGDDLLEQQRLDEALEIYKRAWLLIPEPRFVWEAATWVLAALGDCYYFKKDYVQCKFVFSEARKCPDGLSNPFINLRIGQSAYELGEMSLADDELTRAYMGAGREIFENDDPKYIERLRQVLKPPIGQDDL